MREVVVTVYAVVKTVDSDDMALSAARTIARPVRSMGGARAYEEAVHDATATATAQVVEMVAMSSVSC